MGVLVGVRDPPPGLMGLSTVESMLLEKPTAPVRNSGSTADNMWDALRMAKLMVKVLRLGPMVQPMWEASKTT